MVPLEKQRKDGNLVAIHAVPFKDMDGKVYVAHRHQGRPRSGIEITK